MRTLLALCVCIGVAATFDCYGQNNSCAKSHMKCDKGYDPYCEHMAGPFGMLGFCTCDKHCTSAADCSNAGETGCPQMSHPMCDTMNKVCHCFGP